MIIEVRRKDREASQSLVHRFTKAVRQSGILLETRKRQFHRRTKSDLAKKRSAIVKEERKREYERIKKMSKPE